MEGQNIESYIISNGDEVLAARLVPESEKTDRIIEMGYGKARGIRGFSFFARRGQVYGHMVLPDGTMLLSGPHADFVEGTSRLGPELRKRLPEDWKEVLGGWFARKESEEVK